MPDALQMTEEKKGLTRVHGRSATQLRNLSCARGTLQRADGSAKWTQDNSSVLAAVYGPRQAQLMREDAEEAVVEVNVKPRTAMAEFKERGRYECIIRRTVEAVVRVKMHPRTTISIILQVLQDDGSLLSCLLNATCAALVDAGIPMTSLFGSMTCALLPGPLLVVDPTSKEEEVATAVVSITHPFHFDLTAPRAGGKPVPSVDERILTSYTWGSFSLDQYLDILGTCHQGASEVAEFTRLFLKHNC